MEHYDDHCWVCFLGVYWKINRMHPGWIEGRRMVMNGQAQYVIIDVSHVNWEEYCKRAIEIIERRFG